MSLVDMVRRATGLVNSIPEVLEDNRSTVCLAKSKETGRLRHVDVSYHYTKWLVEEKRVEIKWVESENQVADFLTKPLRIELFEKCRRSCLGG